MAGRWCPVSGLTSLLALAMIGQSAAAGDWKLTDSLSASATLVDRSGGNSQSGVVAQFSPRITLSGRGARAKADVNYGLSTSVGIGDSDPRGVAHSLVATGQVEAVEDFFFLGASAGASLVGNSATSGPVDAINAVSDGTQSYSLSLKPEFRHRLNKYANLTSSNSVNHVTYGGNAQNSDGSLGTSVNLGVGSGRYFGPLSWNLNATRSTTDYEAREDSTTSYTAGLGYRLSSRWAVNGSVGYEENDVQTNRSDTDGPTWNARAVWTPNPRTSLTANYGYRYIGNTYSGSFSHRSRRTSLSVNVSRDVTNRRSAQLVDSFFFLVDQNGNVITDPNTGAPLIVNIPQLEQTDEDYLNTQLSAGVTVTGLRTNVTVTGNVSNRQYEVTGRDEDSYGITVGVSRQLGGDLSAGLSSGVTHTEGAVGGDSDTYDVQLSLSRSLSRRTSASLTVLHRQYDASAGDDYTENRIGISLTTSFL